MSMETDQTTAATAPVEAPDSERWSWLENTYWFVPEAYLRAIALTDPSTVATKTLVDQTLWWIERFDHGYLIGSVATSFDNQGFGYFALVGSVTPDGEVYLSFSTKNGGSTDAASPSQSPPVIGVGRMVQYQGKWAFLMQMTSGTQAFNVSHWAYMVQSTPSDESWTNIPGVPNTSIGTVFA